MCSGSAPETSEPDTSWEEPLWSVHIEDLDSAPSAVKTDMYLLNSPWDTRIFNNNKLVYKVHLRECTQLDGTFLKPPRGVGGPYGPPPFFELLF